MKGGSKDFRHINLHLLARRYGPTLNFKGLRTGMVVAGAPRYCASNRHSREEDQCTD